jgi:hypothetical protein
MISIGSRITWYEKVTGSFFIWGAPLRRKVMRMKGRKLPLKSKAHVFALNMVVLSMVLGRPEIVFLVHLLGCAFALVLFSRVGETV